MKNFKGIQNCLVMGLCIFVFAQPVLQDYDDVIDIHIFFYNPSLEKPHSEDCVLRGEGNHETLVSDISGLVLFLDANTFSRVFHHMLPTSKTNQYASMLRC